VHVDGATVLITGAASGLGEATARRFHQDGANVVLLDLPASAGTARAEELGDRTVFAPADVRDEEAVAAAVATAVERFGRLDVAVSCAGIGPPQRIVSRNGPHDLGLFIRVVEVNLIGTFNVLRLAAAQMAAQEPGVTGERGVIVNTASIAAYDGQVGQVAYSASKGGIVSLTLPAARDLARHAIRVVTLAPGVFATPLVTELPPQAIAELEDGVPFPARLGNPAEFAQTVAQVVENTYLNGTTIRVDGALRMS
jgi:NAD(P)-dependent dehydrogenase (short-subunit alcohol dehydrogenase family)